ncbi:hypothetical protein [Cohnella terricola]|uniref:DUF4352 domain-containing protein n=1 Tax=Cohnella terricola TaxID=1289167 RepID=A0A559JB29_9BACL|nr:hypothetical protein [Cohnella terricola]TVX97084.1 hypothetical protein FPZ45_19180 [Cohnella terricola]
MNRFKKLSVFVLAFSIIGTSLQSVPYAKEAAAASTVKVLEPVTLGNVKLKDNVMAKVSNLIVMPSNTNQIVGLTLTIQNNSNAEINFLDYWVNLYTKSGTKLSLQMADSKAGKIPAKSTVNIDFVGTLGNSIKITDLIVKVIKWDFSAPAYMRVLGQLSVPTTYNPITASTNGRSVITGDVKASFVVKQATIGKSESYYRPDIKLTIKNSGNRTITLPEYQLFILTKNNLMYPLTVQDMKGATLDPLTEKEFQLTASIPIAVEESGWKLAVINSINEGKDKQPLALFNLPKAQVDSGDVVGKYYTFSNSQGIYNIKLNSMNRLPIDDEDLVISNLTIANKGNTTLPFPVLTGKYILNDSIEKTVTSTNLNKIISIKPGGTANIQLVSRVPYTFDISNLSLVVQQKEKSSGSNEQLNDLVKFTTKGKFDAIDKVSYDKGYKIEDVGYRSEIKVKNQKLHTGVSVDLLVAQVTIENQEKRQIIAQKLAGYFEKPDGTVFPATFDNVTEKLSPGGTAVVYVSAAIPKNTDIKDINLVVGKAITETASSTPQSGEGTETLVGYTDPHSIKLPALSAPQEGLQNIDLSPFELSITRVGTQTRFDINEVSLNFEYSLKTNLLTKANTKDHKIIFEIKDDTRDYAFSRELALPSANPTGSGSENAALMIGENKIALQPWVNDKFVFLIDVLKDFHLNVYYQVQPGFKVLIASQKLPWYVDKKLN